MVEFSTWVGSLNKIAGGLVGKRLYVRLSDGQSAYTEPGQTADDLVVGDDPRLSDAREPVVHAQNHTANGSDAIKLDALAAPEDTNELDANTSTHGLLPKLSGNAGQFLNGTGDWATPVGTGDAKDIGLLFSLSANANPGSPFAAESLSNNAVIHITDLDHDLTINSPSKMSLSDLGRYLVIYKIAATEGVLTITMGNGFIAHTGVPPTLQAQAGAILEITTWTDDGGATWTFAGDVDIAALPEKASLTTEDKVLVADSSDNRRLKSHPAPEGAFVGTAALTTKIDKDPASPLAPAGIWIGAKDQMPEKTKVGVLYFGI